MPRYTVATPDPSSTAGLYLGSAITPSFTRAASSYQSRGQVYGCPGTAKVPVGHPSTSTNSPIAKAMGGLFYSGNAPDWIAPSLYFENDAPENKEHANVQFLGVDVNVNVYPTPASRPQNTLYADPYRAHIGGANQIVQPQVVPVWLGRSGG